MSAYHIHISDLTVTYRRHPAVHHLSACFEAGSLTAVVGPNGAGKSTLLKTLAGLLTPAEGTCELGGLAAGELAYLPQQAEIDRSFPVSVFELATTGLWWQTGPFAGLNLSQQRRVLDALAAVGLEGFAGRIIGSLSSGQLQRLLFARVLLQDAPVILLDEPFNAIDARTTADLLGVLQTWHRERRTIVAVLHDLDQVRAHFPQALLLAREPIAFGPTAEVLSTENLRRARAMAEAWDEDAAVCRRAAG